MNTYVKVSIVSILRICIKKHNLTQIRDRHSQVQGRLCLLHLSSHIATTYYIQENEEIINLGKMRVFILPHILAIASLPLALYL